MNNANVFCQALNSRKCVRFDYEGHPRKAEVHAVGVSKKGETVVRFYQVGGGSRSKDALGWKIMIADKATSVAILPEDSLAPRDGYKRGDRFMSEIIVQY